LTKNRQKLVKNREKSSKIENIKTSIF